MAVQVDREGKYITVKFPYERSAVERVKTLPGARWDKKAKRWLVPLDMTNCRLLREQFGKDLHIEPELRSWAIEQKRIEERLGSISAATSGKLERLPEVMPELYRALYLGPLGKNARSLGITDAEIDMAMNVFSWMTGREPWDPEYGSYQTADVRFLADAVAPGNFNHQGLGKTIEQIAEVWEAGREQGFHLVICPQSAIEGTWAGELAHWQRERSDEVAIFPLVGSRKNRQAMLDEFWASDRRVQWVVVNPAMLTYRKDPINTSPIAFKARPKDEEIACHCDRLADCHWHYEPPFPELFDVKWNTIINDEVHKGNIRNHRSLTSRAVNNLKLAPGGKKIAMSGTPMKKRGGDIWGVLHWLRPEVFTSSWKFWEQYFEVTSNGFGKKVGPFRKERSDAFFSMLQPYALRRTKAECLPYLPDKLHVDVACRMEGRQKRQYEEMEAAGAAQLADDSTVTTTSILAELTRLRQFANAFCTTEGGRVVPTAESCKISALLEKLEETGIFEGAGGKTLIFSQFREMVELVHSMLVKLGVKSAIISGKTNKPGYRKAIMDRFQEGDLEVICIVTTAGGVSLTLDAADSAHFIDESWAPDDQEQAEDRVHRGSRMHQVTIYHYRSMDTIDETIAVESSSKDVAHKFILDGRRKYLASK